MKFLPPAGVFAVSCLHSWFSNVWSGVHPYTFQVSSHIIAPASLAAAPFFFTVLVYGF